MISGVCVHFIRPKQILECFKHIMRYRVIQMSDTDRHKSITYGKLYGSHFTTLSNFDDNKCHFLSKVHVRRISFIKNVGRRPT